MNRIIVIIFTFLFFQVKSQTIIINEISNGASGNKEYVEFVVASNTVTYSCSNTTPPCIDIRGWIFDDNSGLHGGINNTGVAAGAIRFSQNSLWSCVPLGTIILIYNGTDKNPAIPANDLTMADGNCKIVAPVSNTLLFESNITTPGAVSCSYPSTGWTAGGDWSNTLLANGGDCARIVNLAGCEVFSVCYGTANTNNLIYFSGNGGQTVFYFNNGNPNLQSNWSSGSASTSPGNQTPGTANNAANATYISQFNNSCVPITPIVIGTASVTNAGCICNGSATVNASGSIAPYTYIWYDASNNAIGQTASTATALCAGVYKVVSTSYIGCKDSVNVTIASSSSSVPTVTVTPSVVNICSGQSVVVSATSNSTVNYSWSTGAITNSVSLNSAGVYTVSASNSCGNSSATVSVSISSAPTLTIISSSNQICASGQTATLSLIGSTGTYTWSTGVNTPTVNVNSPGVYSAIVSAPGCGNAVASISLTSAPLPVISITPIVTNTLCSGGSIILTANSNEGNYLWSNGATTNTVSVNTASITVTSTNACGTSQASQTLNIIATPTVVVSPTASVICSGSTSITITATSNASNYIWSTGDATNSIVVNTPGIKTVSVSNACGTATASTTITSLTLTPLIVTSTSNTICPNETATLTVSGGEPLTSGSSVLYSWSNSSSTNSVVTTNGGIITVSNTNACGTNTASININIVNINASISANPLTGIAPLIVNLTNNSTGANSYSWVFGNGNSANTQTVTSQTYYATGNYIVYLSVSNGVCTDIDSLTINVLEEGPTLYVPNAFTPNGDSINDIFNIGATNIKQYDIIIFDRWGLKLFSSSDIQHGWDGKVNGNIVCDGTYFFLINAIGNDNVGIRKQGAVTLFK